MSYLTFVLVVSIFIGIVVLIGALGFSLIEEEVSSSSVKRILISVVDEDGEIVSQGTPRTLNETSNLEGIVSVSITNETLVFKVLEKTS